MWATLRSDLKEFVSTVTDESTQVLEKIDNKLQDAEDAVAAKEHQNSKEGAVTFDESGNVVTSGESSSDFESTGIIASALDEKTRRQADPETFLVPLIVPNEEEENDGDGEENDDENENQEERDFVENFDLDAKTEEIAQLLEENPDTLGSVFETLVPTQVTYEEFWQRYYYRCNEERIAREWELQQEIAREARAKALEAGITSVKNLFGGAVQAVSNKLHQEQEEPKLYAFDTPQSPQEGGGIGAALFGSGGRPPFVMNTAVSEDDENDEEEEELGWDDDDDEDDYQDEEEDLEESYIESENEEQIDFSASLKEEVTKLNEKLAQAVEERDSLHETVEMQSKEIAKLQKQEGASDDVSKLKMEVFEKDSELAALKASLDDTHEDSRKESEKKDAAKVAALEREVERLTDELSQKANEKKGHEEKLQEFIAENEQLQTRAESDKSALEQVRGESQADKKALLEIQTLNAELEGRLACLQDALAKSQEERTRMEESMGARASQVTAAQQEAAAAETKIEYLTSRVEELEGQENFTRDRAEHLEQEVTRVKQELERKESEFAARLLEEQSREKAASSPVSSASSGVNIPTPMESPVGAAAASHMDAVPDEDEEDGNEDDGWGDDW